MDDTEERQARAADAEHTWRVSLAWTAAAAGAAFAMALLGWP